MQTPPDTPHTLDRFSIRRAPLVFLLLLAGLGIRLYPVFQLDIEPRGDRELLVSLLADEWRSNWSYSLEGHPTAVMMPVYPVVVGLLRWVMPDSWTPLLVLQALLGTLAAWFVFRIAWRISRIPGVAWGTFFLCLFYPPLILLGLKIEPGMLYAFSLAFGIWLLSFTLVRTAPLAHILLAAFLFMGVIYLSPKILILIPFLAVWAGLKSYDRLTGMLGAFALCLACIVCLMPWMARNFISTGGSFLSPPALWLPSSRAWPMLEGHQFTLQPTPPDRMNRFVTMPDSMRFFSRSVKQPRGCGEGFFCVDSHSGSPHIPGCCPELVPAGRGEGRLAWKVPWSTEACFSRSLFHYCCWFWWELRQPFSI
ncbi:MAG: hypothetical protein IPI28_03020 [Candidatus Omnitrophica bacterium]|nr:hypothetical protein [Candidatus Omnitrophota bacterium]